jgi:GNAT superfamily N-acetyltransferase
MIRFASLRDLESLLELGEMIFSLSDYGEISPFDRKSVQNSLIRWIEAPEMCVFVAAEHNGKGEKIVGMAVAVLYPHFYNITHYTGQELVWWVDPTLASASKNHGASLLLAMENWARHKGARSFTMGVLEAIRPEAVARFYRRHGYQAQDRHFTRRL